MSILSQLSNINHNEFINDPRNYGSAERFLQLAIETTLNIGNHIISTYNFEAPKDYSDIFIILGNHGVLPKGFAKELTIGKLIEADSRQGNYTGSSGQIFITG